MADRIEAPWEYQRYCAAVEAEVARFVELVAHADPATPVPTCAGWTIADLVKHHGTTHQWIEHLVRHRPMERIRSPEVPLDLPDHPGSYPEWLAESAASLVATLRATDPDTPMWTNGADQHARYWARRMLYEAVVHRADAELALGREPAIDPETAVDGVDEFLTNLAFFQWLADGVRDLGRHGDTLHLHATDCDGEWMITLGPDGVTWAHGHGKGTVAVRATASDLLLLTYGRLRPADGRFVVFGDQQLLEHWLKACAF